MKASNARVAHAFIHNERYTRGSNMYWHEYGNGTRVMYSYGTHFPLASIVPDFALGSWLFVNEFAHTRSKTTQRHAHHVLSAKTATDSVVYVDCPRTFANTEGARFADSVVNSVRLSAHNYERHINAALRSRTNIRLHLQSASGAADNALDVLRYFVRMCGRPFAEIDAAVSELEKALPPHAAALMRFVLTWMRGGTFPNTGISASGDGYPSVIAAFAGEKYERTYRILLSVAMQRNERHTQRQAEARAQRQERKRQREAESNARAVERFMSGYRLHLSEHTKGRELARVEGGTLYTSKGYTTKADRGTLAMVRDYVESLRAGESFTEHATINGTTFRVVCNGETLHIGCHAFQRADVEAIATACGVEA